MDSLDIAKVCLRRWYAFVPIVVLALLAGYRLAGERQTTYTAVGGFALVYHAPPGNSSTRTVDPRTLNPLVSGGVALLQQTIVADFSNPSTLATVARQGGHDPFTVAVPKGSAILEVTATGTSAKGAVDTVGAVLALAPQRVAALQTQAGAPKAGQYVPFVTSPAQLNATSPPSKVKLLLAFAGIGLVVGAGIALLLERMVATRRLKAARSRRRQRAEPSMGSQFGTETELPGLSADDLSADDLSAGGLSSGGLSGNGLHDFADQSREFEDVPGGYRGEGAHG